MKDKLPPLNPIISPWIENIVSDFSLQKELIEIHQSPLNIHHLRSFQSNIGEYRVILAKYNFKSKIFYARKANKCSTLASMAYESGIGVDTASYAELKQCLDLNIDSKDLVLTAAIKNKKLLRLAVQNRVLIIIDNEDEVNLILELAKQENKQAIIGFRVSGFEFKNRKLKSRFGFDIDEISSFILRLYASDKISRFLKFDGFQFHLDGYSTQERVAAIHQTLDLIETLKTYDFSPTFIDIGGGFLINYLKSETEWEHFKTELHRAVLGQRDAITYDNNGLGFRNRNGKIEGSLATYPYFNKTPKELFLKNILEVTSLHQKSVSQRLQNLNIELRLEPGRSLLDQVGITMATVAHRKKNAQGDFLIGLEMNMTQMASSSADFLLDPVVSYANPQKDKLPVEVYFTGAYCLERDFIIKRKILLPKLPEIGDTVTFINTAGYMMHFFETEAHLFELSQNIFVNNCTENINISQFYTDKNNRETNHIYL